MNEEINLKALSTTAYAYFDRGSCVQYDQLKMNRSGKRREDRRQPGRSPEYATQNSTLHLDCSSYVWSVYNETFGIKLPACLTDSMIELSDIRVFYYERTFKETDEEISAVLEKFKETLLPGDAVVTRNLEETNGHIMLFVEGGKVLHCTYILPGGDYNYKEKTDHFESYGGIMEFKAEDYWTAGTRRYIFGPKIKRSAILRPYGENDKPTAKALARVRGLSRIAVFKTCSRERTNVCEKGEERTYEILVKNVDQTARKITVVDEPPEGTRGEKLRTEFYLAPLESRTVKYKVKATGEKDIIISRKTRVNGVLMNTVKTLCGKKLSEKKKALLRDACKSSRASGWSFVKNVYKKALGVELPFKNAEELMNAYIEPSDDDTLVRFKKTDMTVPGLYGGKNMQTYKKDRITRTREIRPGDFETGDILVYSDEKDVHVYLCTGEWEFFSGGKAIRGKDAYALTESLLGQYAFFVLRP